MSSNDETRNWTQLVNDKIYLQEQLRDLKVKLGLAHIVNTDLQREKAARILDIEDLRYARTRTYQTTGDGVAEIDMKFAAHMFWAGVDWKGELNFSKMSDKELLEYNIASGVIVDAEITTAIEEWKARDD